MASAANDQLVDDGRPKQCALIREPANWCSRSRPPATLQPLLSEEFDPKVFATSIIQCQMVGETLQKLTNGITTLDQELYSQVVTNYEDLLSQATGIEALESEPHPLYLPSLVPMQASQLFRSRQKSWEA